MSDVSLAHDDVLPLDAAAPDDALLAASRRGSDAAYAILYERYWAHAMARARHHARSAPPEDLEDAVEAAFTRVLRALRRGNGPSSRLMPYLSVVVRRELWRARASHRRHEEVELVAHHANGGRTEAAAVDAALADESIGGLLSDSFAELPDRWRKVLWMAEVEGRPATEIGASLGLAPNAASALVYRARNGLRAMYLEHYLRARPEACRPAATALVQGSGVGGDGVPGPVAAHLESCDSCRNLARGQADPLPLLGAAAPFGLLTLGRWADQAAERAPSGAGLWWSAAGATAAAGVLGLAWFLAPGGDTSSVEQATSSPEPIVSVLPAPGVDQTHPEPATTASGASPVTPLRGAEEEGEQLASGGAAEAPVEPAPAQPASPPSSAVPTTPSSTMPTASDPTVTDPSVPLSPVDVGTLGGRFTSDDGTTPVAGVIVEVTSAGTKRRASSTLDGRWSVQVRSGGHQVRAWLPLGRCAVDHPDLVGPAWIDLGVVSIEPGSLAELDLVLVRCEEAVTPTRRGGSLSSRP